MGSEAPLANRRNDRFAQRGEQNMRRGSFSDLTWLFWTKLCEKLSLERSFGYAEEEVQR